MLVTSPAPDNTLQGVLSGVEDDAQRDRHMGDHQEQFLWGKALGTRWPTSAQLARWHQRTREALAQWFHPVVLQVEHRAPHLPQPARAIHAEPGTAPGLPECVVALAQMQRALRRETTQRQELERAFRQIRKALIQAEADLACLRGVERQARHQALHDELTSLPNRRHLLEQLGQALVQRETGHNGPTVIYIDLDQFKAVNDTHGHAVGDEVLRITAARLSAAVRHGDLVVRLGGDEFACLLAGGADVMPLRQLCAKLLEAVSLPMQVHGLQLLVRPSIGVAMCPEHATAVQGLLSCADAAMYAAKRKRCGFAFYGQTD